MNENQIKQLKEENERLKNHYLDTDIDIAYLTKEIEQLKNRVKELESSISEFLDIWKSTGGLPSIVWIEKMFKELLNNKNKEQE
jgi:cell division septum initiation protein DivIVA